MKKIDIYTGPMCNYCSAAKHLLSKKNAKYNEMDIGTDTTKMDEMLKRTNGARSVPQIFIGNYYVGGYDQLKALEVEGKLDSLLKD
ncbi:MAG: glutaredoxin 3 [Candidatus Pelagibacter sp.]|nr:glutaredoxin 3 [Candidatus Pelagibacter sp.]